jgi:CubicO group peptidase (beta-lactamase class C family)
MRLSNLMMAAIGAAAWLLAARAGYAQFPATPDLTSAADAAGQLEQLHSLLVSRRGELLLEHYAPKFSAGKLANIKSASKSIIAALTGIALERGLLKSVTDPIGAYLPQLARAPAAKRAITIEDLLTMRAGLASTSGENYGPWVRSRNWVQYALDRPLVSEPGTAMQYSTGTSHILSAILTRVSKKSTWQFAQDAIAKPLGISLARWTRDPQGIYLGGNEMLMTPRQMVAFGELSEPGPREGPPGGAVRVGRHLLPAADVLALGSHPRVRLRLVDPGGRRPSRVLRVGPWRPVHLHLPRPRSRGRRHVGNRVERGAPRISTAPLSIDRAARDRPSGAD